MLDALTRYARWLHLQFPGGSVEKLPRVDDHYRTNVRGVYVVGDLAGVPLLKFSLDGGVRVVRHMAEEGLTPGAGGEGVADLVVVGAGASGMAAAREAEKRGWSYVVLEAARRFATLKDFQAGKPIYTYPQEMTPAGDLQVTADVKEALVDEMEAQTEDLDVRAFEAVRVERADGTLAVVGADGERVRAQRVVVALGRSGNYRRLGVPGEERKGVHHRLQDPQDYAGADVLVVGGGDAAAEAALGLAEAGAHVTVSYRRDRFVRPKPESVERLHRLAEAGAPSGGTLDLVMESEVVAIEEGATLLRTPVGERRVASGPVFAMIGREAPVDFFRRSGIHLRNDWGDLPGSWRAAVASLDWLGDVRWLRVAAFAAFFLFMGGVYSWKDGGLLYRWAQAAGTFPFVLADAATRLPAASLPGVVVRSAASPSFYYTLAYSLIVVVFGWRRIRRRKTPYVWWQTVTLAAIQVVPLFILPEIVLPYLGAHGGLPQGLMDALFPASEYATHGREYWRAYGFILAWPLNVYNVFTTDPLGWWLVICFVQTFVLIPGMIYYWGKGAYCGWICSCGALAETLGDQHRDKMPHGEGWNKLNMAGQVILALALLLLVFRVAGWVWGGWPAQAFNTLMYGEWLGLKLGYGWLVDVVLAGMVGYGVYFWLSGRFWCRFFCPLAALMHVYARFSRFRILADQKKCISCNVCTSVCHQGIDIMHYAQQGLPMDDPQCVRCSACVQSCPTGVLSFGQVDPATKQVITVDELEASATRIREQEAARAWRPDEPGVGVPLSSG